MKSLQILAASAITLASFAFTGTAMSQTVVRISGATTYRAPVSQAILDALDSSPTPTVAFDASNSGSLFGASAAIFKGNIGGSPVIVKTFFTGSLAGVVDLAQQNNITSWIASSVTGTAAPGTNINGTGYAKETAPCQAALSDAFYTSVAAALGQANSNGKAAGQAIRKLTFVDAGDANGAGGVGTIGIVPFAWVSGNVTKSGVPTYTYTVMNADGTASTKTDVTVPFGNVTQQQAASLINGPVPLTFFTGNSADSTKYVLLIGRNEDSGTRIAAFAEGKTGFGNGDTQFQLSFANNQTAGGGNNTGGANSSIIGGAKWPFGQTLNTAPTISWASAGHSGYVGGGDVGNVLKSVNPVLKAAFTNGITGVSGTYTHAYFMGYMGIADASGAVNGGATMMTYNGVPYSVANVKNGLYSFWAFEHLYYLSDGSAPLSGVGQTAVNAIADKIFTVDADLNSSGVHNTPTAAGIFYDSNVLVTRSAEGDVITANY